MTAARPAPRPATTDPVALASVPLFRGLSAAQLARLGNLLQGRVFPAGSTVFWEEDAGEVAYVVRDGFVRLQVEPAGGGSTILGILGPGEIVGEMSLVDRLGRSATVVAHERATLYAIGRAAFWACLREMPAMTYNLVNVLSRRLRLANEHNEALATLDVEGRVARQLLVFAEEYGEAVPAGVRIPFRLPQADLAGLVGASRVRVNQGLVDLKRRGVLAVDPGHRVTILDQQTLAAAAR